MLLLVVWIQLLIFKTKTEKGIKLSYKKSIHFQISKEMAKVIF